MSCDDVIDDLPEMPESVHRIATALCGHGKMTMKDLQADSGLARRTVYGALRRLRAIGMIDEFPNLRDTRQSWFVLRRA